MCVANTFDVSYPKIGYRLILAHVCHFSLYEYGYTCLYFSKRLHDPQTVYGMDTEHLNHKKSVETTQCSRTLKYRQNVTVPLKSHTYS